MGLSTQSSAARVWISEQVSQLTHKSSPQDLKSQPLSTFFCTVQHKLEGKWEKKSRVSLALLLQLLVIQK